MLIDTNEFILIVILYVKYRDLTVTIVFQTVCQYNIGKKWIQIMLGRTIVYLFHSLCLQFYCNDIYSNNVCFGLIKYYCCVENFFLK